MMTTVAKTEAAQRPLRVNELVSLAEILDASLEKLVAPSFYRNMTVTAAREMLSGLKTQIAEIDEEIAQLAQQVEELHERIDGLTYARNENAWIARLLEQRLALEADE